ncbi:hypothetical protein EMCRGX_G024130 [Ephydatia muelleri]
MALDYKEVGRVIRGALDLGRLKIQSNGIFFKSSKSGEIVQINDTDVSNLEWMRVARGYEVKVVSNNGSVTKFDGFKESDFQSLKDFFSSQFKKDLREVELCVKGWNWGDAKFEGALLSFMVDSKPAFEIPLEEVSQAIPGKNEITLEFHQNDDTPVSLVEMRFHIPNMEGSEDPVKEFHKKVIAKADVMQATGDAIVVFPEVPCLTPRGRYGLKAYLKFLHFHGKTFDYKIPYNTITKLLLLPHNDQRNMFFVLALDPPIRQGQTRYNFVILQLPIEEKEFNVTLSLSEDELKEKYEGKLSKNMTGQFYEVFSKVLRVLVGRKVTVPGTYKNSNNQTAITCSHRATSGFLYPLDKGFIFVHKPAVYVKFEDIVCVNFARMSGVAGVSRSFDFDLDLKDGTTMHFSSLMKDDYSRLHEFVLEKNLKIKSKGKSENTAAAYKDESSDSENHDAYLERMKAEGEDKDSEDEDSDFVAPKSGSDDDLEFNSDAKSSSEGEAEGGEGGRKRKRRKNDRRQRRERVKAAPPNLLLPRRKKGKLRRRIPMLPRSPSPRTWCGCRRRGLPSRRSIRASRSLTLRRKAGEMWKEVADKSPWHQKAKELKAKYDKELAEYKASGKATAVATPASGHKPKPTPSSKSPKKAQQPSSSRKSTESLKYKSAEFVKSDEDTSAASENEEDEKKAPSVTTKGETTLDMKTHSTRSKRGVKGGGAEEQLVSLPSEGSESDASESSGSGEEDTD